MMKLSERLEHWEDMSPMEFVAVRKEVAQLEEENAVLKRENERLREVHKASKVYFVHDPNRPLTETGALDKMRLQQAFVLADALLADTQEHK